MTFSKFIKIVAASFIICMLPLCSFAQNEEKAPEKERTNKDWMIWNKVSDWNWDINWKMPSFDFFKFKKVNKAEKVDTHNNQYSVGTNLLNWAYFGTANLEFNASLNNHFSVFAGGKYNGFKFETKSYKEVFANQITGYAGIKWWPWLVNTGWWVGVKGQYSDFSNAGITTSYLKEGVAVGGGLLGGYSFMLGTHFNLDLGLGIWGGTYLDYVDYEKPDAKENMFVKLDNIQVSFTYFF